MTMLDQKGLEAAAQAMMPHDPGPQIVEIVRKDAEKAIRAYLSTVTPADVAGLVERLRGIYRIPITDGLGAVGSGEEPDNPNEFVRKFDTPPIQHEAAIALETLSTSLTTELAAHAETKREINALCQLAIDNSQAAKDLEVRLNEALKALEPFAKAADNFDDFKIKNEGEWFAYSGVQSIDGSIGSITVADLRAARRALTGGKE